MQVDDIDFLASDAAVAIVQGGSTQTSTSVAIGPGYAAAGAVAAAQGINPSTKTFATTAVTDWLSHGFASASAQTTASSSNSYSTGFASGGSMFIQNSNQTWG